MANTEDTLKKQDKRSEETVAIAKEGLNLAQMSFDLQETTAKTTKSSEEIDEEKLILAKRAFKWTVDSTKKGLKLAA